MLSDTLGFIEGPLLGFVFFFAAAGLSLRLLFFLGNMLASPFRARRTVSLPGTVFNLFRSLLPLHNVTIQKPIYTVFRYGFHCCLFIVPIWYSGHVGMWEESSLEWYWEPLPDEWIDTMTLCVIGLGLWFAVRRMILPDVRRGSSPADFLIIAIAVSPFVTGYWYTHGTLDHIEFFRQYMWYFHVISGEVMLMMMVLLFCRTRLRADKCVACAACEINCPTRTLNSVDTQSTRIFTYSHYQCICCATCVKVCPEGAAELRHEIGVGHFFQVFIQKTVGEAALTPCDRCGAYFAPTPQVAKLDTTIAGSSLELERIEFCNRCKKIVSARRF